MRLFVAVDVDDETRARIGRVSDQLRAELERPRSAARIAWVIPERLHLTLVFLGEVSDSTAHAITARLRPPVDLSPFQLDFGALGTFPPSGRPRVVWLGVDRGGEALVALHAEVARRLADIAFRRESRAFSPHLTLARYKEGGTRVEAAQVAAAQVEPAGGCTIDRVTLYQSRLSPRGPTYTPVLVTPLVAPEAGA